MQTKTLGIVIFALGVLTLFSYTAFSFLWAMAGFSMSYPLVVKTESFGLFMLMTPPLGALIMVIGGLIYGKKEVIK